MPDEPRAAVNAGVGLRRLIRDAGRRPLPAAEAIFFCFSLFQTVNTRERLFMLTAVGERRAKGFSRDVCEPIRDHVQG